MERTNTTFESNLNFSSFSSVEFFQFYYTPLLVHFGWIGNGLSVLVFCRTKLRKLSSSFYLVALAISDSVFLLALFVTWLNMIHVDLFNRQGICQAIVYATGVCSFLSVWLVVAFTVERFVAVRRPLLRRAVCTVSRAKSVIIVLVFIGALLFSPLLIFARPQFVSGRNTTLCTIVPEWQNEAAAFALGDFVIAFVIPVLLIGGLNARIARTAWKLGAVRHRLSQLKGGCDVSGRNRTTKMLLMVSTTFLCLNLPSYVMRMLTYLIELELMEQTPTFVMVQHYCLQLFNTNFGINFALYCISGQNFRRALKSLFCRRRLERNGTTAFANSLTQPIRRMNKSTKCIRRRINESNTNEEVILN